MKKQSNKKVIFFLFTISFLFTILDYALHLMIEQIKIWAYPIFIPEISTSPLFWYAVGKFVGTMIIGYILLLVFKVRNLALFSAIVSLLLQFRYFLIENVYYTPQWHFTVFTLHFIILFLVSKFVKDNGIFTIFKRGEW